MIDWKFVLESLEWSKYNYEEKAQKYLLPNGCLDLEYKRLTYEPKIKQFAETISAIQKLKEILTEPVKKLEA